MVSSFKRGDVVQLKSGSPKLLVSDHGPVYVSVVMWDNNSKSGLKQLNFKPDLLRVVKDD